MGRVSGNSFIKTPLPVCPADKRNAICPDLEPVNKQLRGLCTQFVFRDHRSVWMVCRDPHFRVADPAPVYTFFTGKISHARNSGFRGLVYGNRLTR